MVCQLFDPLAYRIFQESRQYITIHQTQCAVLVESLTSL